MDICVNKPLLEAELMKRYIIGRKLIVNDCSRTKITIKNEGENRKFNFRVLDGVLHIRQNVRKIEQTYSRSQTKYFESMNNETLNNLIKFLKMKERKRRLLKHVKHTKAVLNKQYYELNECQFYHRTIQVCMIL